MPEGHTIHRIARDHTRWFVGQTLSISSPQGRFALGARQLDGQRLVSIEALGKHLFYHFEGPAPLHIHLGLYGKFRVHRNPPPEPRGAVRIRASGDERTLDLNGPTACEILDPGQAEEIRDRLGPDPLRKDSDPERAWETIRRRRTPIGALLLDQSVIAGLGNIYRAEIPFLLGIHPERPGREISRAEFDQIWELSVELLRIGVKYNRIITVRPGSTGKTPGRLRRDERLNVYKKDDCTRCGAPVREWLIASRKIYACDSCQS